MQFLLGCERCRGPVDSAKRPVRSGCRCGAWDSRPDGSGGLWRGSFWRSAIRRDVFGNGCRTAQFLEQLPERHFDAELRVYRDCGLSQEERVEPEFGERKVGRCARQIEPGEAMQFPEKRAEDIVRLGSSDLFRFVILPILRQYNLYLLIKVLITANRSASSEE